VANDNLRATENVLRSGWLDCLLEDANWPSRDFSKVPIALRAASLATSLAAAKSGNAEAQRVLPARLLRAIILDYIEEWQRVLDGGVKALDRHAAELDELTKQAKRSVDTDGRLLDVDPAGGPATYLPGLLKLRQRITGSGEIISLAQAHLKDLSKHLNSDGGTPAPEAPRSTLALIRALGTFGFLHTLRVPGKPTTVLQRVQNRVLTSLTTRMSAYADNYTKQLSILQKKDSGYIAPVSAKRLEQMTDTSRWANVR